MHELFRGGRDRDALARPEINLILSYIPIFVFSSILDCQSSKSLRFFEYFPGNVVNVVLFGVYEGKKSVKKDREFFPGLFRRKHNAKISNYFDLIFLKQEGQ